MFHVLWTPGRVVVAFAIANGGSNKIPLSRLFSSLATVSSAVCLTVLPLSSDDHHPAALPEGDSQRGACVVPQTDHRSGKALEPPPGGPAPQPHEQPHRCRHGDGGGRTLRQCAPGQF